MNLIELIWYGDEVELFIESVANVCVSVCVRARVISVKQTKTHKRRTNQDM